MREAFVGNHILSIHGILNGTCNYILTRMAADPSRGVVDADCRVFGVDNLFVASSSVFATAHAYSPTFTILAIARRVASHVAELSVRAGPATVGAGPSPDAGAASVTRHP